MIGDEARVALVALFEHLIVNDDPWVVQIVSDDAPQRPYLQGAHEGSGFLVEVSNNDLHDPPLTAMQVAGIGALGWAKPGASGPNHARTWASLDAASEAAELVVATMTTALGFDDDEAVEVELFESDLSALIEAHPALPLA